MKQSGCWPARGAFLAEKATANPVLKLSGGASSASSPPLQCIASCYPNSNMVRETEGARVGNFQGSSGGLPKFDISRNVRKSIHCERRVARITGYPGGRSPKMPANTLPETVGNRGRCAGSAALSILKSARWIEIVAFSRASCAARPDNSLSGPPVEWKALYILVNKTTDLPRS